MVLAMPFQAITPLPIFLVSLKQGLKSGLQAALVLVGGAYLISQDVQFALLIFALLAAFPLLATWMLHTGWNFSQSAGSGFALGVLILVIILGISANTPLEMEHNLTTSLGAIQERFVTMAQNQSADAKTILEYQQSLEQFFNLLTFLFPAMLVSGWFMLQLANLILTRYLFAKRFGYHLPGENFVGFRVPFFMVWPVIASAIIMMLADGVLLRFSANIGLFLAIPYFFQGWAIIQKYFQHMKVPPFWCNLFYIFIFWSSKIALVVALFGFFDTWLDFRSRLEKTEEDQLPPGR